MLADDAGSLADAQAQLARALVGQSESPVDFDRARLQLASKMLIAKRRRAVLHVLPGLAAFLGERFGSHFERYARDTSLSSVRGAIEDAQGFVNWLRRDHSFSDALRIEIMHLALRTGQRVAMTKSSAPPKLLLGFSVPLLGVRFISIPIARGQRTAGANAR